MMGKKKTMRFRFVNMLVKFSPMPRTELSQRAFNLKFVNDDGSRPTMREFRILMDDLENEGLVTITKLPRTSTSGPKIVDSISATELAGDWLKEQGK
jgi:hypothetical protein